MEWNDVNNFMDLEHELHKKCNQSPMVVAHLENDETLCVGFNGGHARY